MNLQAAGIGVCGVCVGFSDGVCFPLPTDSWKLASVSTPRSALYVV